MSLMTRVRAAFLAIASDIKSIRGSNTIRSLDVDANGLYLIVEENLPGGTLYRRSVLSGGTSPEYQFRTETTYEDDGVTVLSVRVFALSYSASGVLTSEILQ